MPQLPSFLKDKARLEAVARVGLACLFSFILSIAYLPAAIPPASKSIIGITTVPMALKYPAFVSSLLSFLPMMMAAVIFGLGGATALLAAATVSDGLMIAVFAGFALTCSGLFFGKNYSKTGKVAPIVIMLAGILGVSYRGLVQNGLAYSVDSPAGVPGAAGEVVEKVFEAICEAQGSPPDCWADGGPQGSEGIIEVILKGPGPLSGEIAVVSWNAAEGLWSIVIPGGLWMVQFLWTSSGLENPFAAFRNFIIVFCWVFIAMIFHRIVPPLRTMRKFISQDIVPKALKLMKWNDTDLSEEVRRAKGGALIQLIGSLDGGKIAGVTLFEPKILAPFASLVPPLAVLCNETSLSLQAYGLLEAFHLSEKLSDREHQPLREVLRRCDEILDSCAAALQANDAGPLKELHETETTQGVSYDTVVEGTYAHGRSVAVLESTINWLEVLNHPKQDMKNAKQYIPYFALPFMFIVRFFEVLTLPLQPKRWNLRQFLWCCKLTAGFVTLLGMEVFWPAYANFEIETGNPGVTHLYAGWALTCYGALWTPTMEGTTKKGFQRILGTAIGGFIGWIGAMVCSGSSSDDAPLNPYGTVAWLTAVSTIGAYFAVEPGMAAFKGAGYDHGMAIIYCLMVHALVVIDVFVGKASKGDIVANRVVATLTGAALATLFGAIPPVVRGTDPRHAMEYLQALRNDFVSLLQRFLDRGDGVPLATFKKQFLVDASSKREAASYLLRDAGALKIVNDALPCLAADPALLFEMSRMTTTEAFVNLFFSFSEYLSKDETIEVIGDTHSLLVSETEVRKRVVTIVSGLRHENGTIMNDGSPKEEKESGDRPLHEIIEGNSTLSIYMRLTEALYQRFIAHEAALNAVPVTRFYKDLQFRAPQKGSS